MANATTPTPMMEASSPPATLIPTPALGNLNPDLLHGRSMSTFGGTGEPNCPSSCAVEFVYGGRRPARLQRITLPLVCFDGASHCLMRIEDVGRNTLVASGMLGWKGRPAGVARVVSWSHRNQGDGIFICDAAGLQPFHHYRLSLCAQLVGAGERGFAPGLGLWGWASNAIGDASGYLINDRPVPGLAPAWRIELGALSP
ncbi:hypothetical protein [Pelomonas sp. KK5]|uniref:hypothetical protein n=1 Tax=Pelomonas sp. KK5 TaxID=1855730 RepID=UPI00117BF03E|nr:hypothetical protein [Pelomonas sp. KK5]